jgi:hypothetical protein
MKIPTQVTTSNGYELPADCYQFDYTVRVDMWLSAGDVELLRVNSLRHYDFECQRLSFSRSDGRSENGLLTMLANMMTEDGARTVHTFAFRQLDTMRKTLEQAELFKGVDLDHVLDLRERLRIAMDAIRDETMRLTEGQTKRIFPQYVTK